MITWTCWTRGVTVKRVTSSVNDCVASFWIVHKWAKFMFACKIIYKIICKFMFVSLRPPRLMDGSLCITRVFSKLINVAALPWILSTLYLISFMPIKSNLFLIQTNQRKKEVTVQPEQDIKISSVTMWKKYPDIEAANIISLLTLETLCRVTICRMSLQVIFIQSHNCFIDLI